MGDSKNGMYQPIISSIIILVEYNGHITGGYTHLTLYTVYLAVNKFRKFCVFKSRNLISTKIAFSLKWVWHMSVCQ